MPQTSRRATDRSPARFQRLGMLSFHRLDDEPVDSDYVTGLASTPQEDCYGERILPSAFEQDLDAYLTNGLITWGHDLSVPAIGAAELAEVRTDGLLVRIRKSRAYQLARDVWDSVDAGFVRAMSVGFNGEYSRDWGFWESRLDGAPVAEPSWEQRVTAAVRWVWTRAQLCEIAICNLPANAGALLQLSRSLGLPDPDTAALDIEGRALSELARLSGATEALHNLSRHWTARGGAPSAEVLRAAASPLALQAELLRAGQDLSPGVRAEIERAVTALQEVLAENANVGAAGSNEEPDRADTPPILRIVCAPSALRVHAN